MIVGVREKRVVRIFDSSNGRLGRIWKILEICLIFRMCVFVCGYLICLSKVF